MTALCIALGLVLYTCISYAYLIYVFGDVPVRRDDKWYDPIIVAPALLLMWIFSLFADRS